MEKLLLYMLVVEGNLKNVWTIVIKLVRYYWNYQLEKIFQNTKSNAQ